jgi:PAS domain S-box-containing protein
VEGISLLDSQIVRTPRVLENLLKVSARDPDDARRQRLLNILLLGVGVLTLLGILAVAVADLFDLISHQEIVASQIYPGGIAALFGIVCIFAINRYLSGELASILFLLLLTGVFVLSDTPQNVVDGRTVFLFAIPILMASVLLRPWASFGMAAGISGLIAAIAVNIAFVPPVPTMLGLFAIAMVAWLSARSLENALENLRVINRELDQRVAERTQDLAEALSENEAILESIVDGVIVFDDEQRASVVNPAMARLIRRAPRKILGASIEELMRGQVRPQDQKQLRGFLRDRESSYSGLKLQWGQKTLSVSMAPVYDDRGAVTGTVAVFRDFTREARVDQMKDAFVSMVSHELRTPLNAVLGYADMLQESVYGPLTDRQRGATQRIIANTDQLLGIVNNILDEAQIKSGTIKLNIGSFTPRELIDGVLGVMSVLAQAKDIEIEGRVDEDLPPLLFGDKQRLHQVLVNLVSNGIKYTPDGKVSIRAYRRDADHWALEVADTGAGIPPEAQAYIFEPFRRVDDTATRTKEGVGLGLSIVKQLTALMGGEIELTSRVGEGSTFTIVLPMVLLEEELV